MKELAYRFSSMRLALVLAVAGMSCAGPRPASAQAAPANAAPTPAVPDWALPGSPTHKQYPPPADFHRPTKTFDQPIGIFEGQSDVGGPLVPGSASYDAKTRQYTINSAGYNIWYTRDEFRFLWKKMSGDISLAANGSFPIPSTPHDRKIVLILRQDLEDDSKEIMVGEHGTGMVHLAERPVKNAEIKDMQYRIGGSLLPAVMPQRIGIEKHGDEVSLFISVKGEPMHQFGPALNIHFDGPFYVGVGFCSHYPVTVDTGIVSDLSLENSAGKVR
jgi:hypothetical protein